MDVNEKREMDDEISIDLYELLIMFRRRWKYIVLSALIGGLLVGAYTYFMVSPQYKATSKIYIVSASNNSVVNLSDLQIGTSLTADYKDLILSRPMLESTIQNLDLQGISVNALKKMLSVTSPSGTRIIWITATTTSPKLSKEIANEMARLAISWLPEIMESNAPNIVEEAVAPTARSSPSYKRNLLLGAVVGAALYCAICVVEVFMNDTIKTAEEMEHYFGIVPLTTIPEEKSIIAEDDGTRPAQKTDRLAVMRLLKRKRGQDK